MLLTCLSKRAQCLLALVLLSALPASGQISGGGVDQSGKQQSLTMAGAHTVIDFAAAWCEPCYQALPELQKLADQYPHIRFLIISVDDEKAGRDQLIDDVKLRLPVIWDADHVLIEQFHPKSFPATYVLDANGTIVQHHVGFNQKKLRQLSGVLDQL